MPLMAAPKKKPGKGSEKPKRVRSGYNLNIWIDPTLGAAFDAALADIQPRTSKTALVELLLQEYLRSKGQWPPPEADAPEE